MFSTSLMMGVCAATNRILLLLPYSRNFLQIVNPTQKMIRFQPDANYFIRLITKSQSTSSRRTLQKEHFKILVKERNQYFVENKFRSP